MTTLSRYETNEEQPLELRWLRLVNRPIFLRSAIVATVLGSVLTFINQRAWIAGNDSLQLLPFMLAFLTPFAVVMVAQVAGVRQAHRDSVCRGASASPEGFTTTIASHGIPARAVAGVGVMRASGSSPGVGVKSD